MANEGSPNWLWCKLGCTIERNGFHRTVRDQLGRLVCKNAGYDIELAISSWLYHGAVI